MRAYDPSIRRFLSRDPLGHAALFFSDNPYVYVGNNPITNIDPSGQKVMGASRSQVKHAAVKQASKTRVATRPGSPAKKSTCDPRRQHDTQLILDYLELTRAQNHLGSDILALFADVVIAVVDYLTQSWFSFVTDLVTVIVQGTQVGKDFAILHGASAQSLIGLNQVLAVMQGVVVAMNTVLAVGWFAMLANGPGESCQEGSRKA